MTVSHGIRGKTFRLVSPDSPPPANLFLNNLDHGPIGRWWWEIGMIRGFLRDGLGMIWGVTDTRAPVGALLVSTPLSTNGFYTRRGPLSPRPSYGFMRTATLVFSHVGLKDTHPSRPFEVAIRQADSAWHGRQGPFACADQQQQ